MSVRIDERVGADGAVVLAVTGEVDMGTVQPLREAIADALERRGARNLVVDLDAVTFLDSTGISVLILGHRAANERGARYRVLNAHDMVRRVLDVTGVSEFLES